MKETTVKSQNKTTAIILTIGDELLIGQTVDTNSAWIAQELNKIGVGIKRKVSIGDSWEEIWQSLEVSGNEADIILITGGLGPTSDDITKPLLCKYFNGKLVTNQSALENVIDIFTNKLNRPLIERNLKQAEVPDTCRVIQNKRGTAPGMWFEKEGKIYVSMPGVPHEMKGMMIEDVIPELKKEFSLEPIVHRTLLTAGVGESFLAEMLVDFERSLPEQIKIAYLPNYGMVRIRLTWIEPFPDEKIMNDEFKKLKAITKEYLVIDRDISLQDVISNDFKTSKRTLAVAESCTGGYIAHLITAIPGSSDFFLGGVVCYSNELKTGMLDVPKDIITKYGAVSIETVEKMAEGVRLKTGSDFALATSGIMGPTGGTNEKSVGFVCVAVTNKNKTVSTSFQFRFDRKRNIELTAAHALNFLRKNM